MACAKFPETPYRPKIQFTTFQDMILACSAVNSDEEPELLDFTSGGNAILGAGCPGVGDPSGGSAANQNNPLFFSANHGLVTVLSNNATQAGVGGAQGERSVK